MSQAAARIQTLSPLEQLRYGREVLRLQSQALDKLGSRLDADFCTAIEHLLACRGSVVVTGMGKAGLVGQKVSATLASTGTRSIFLHPGEALHGDLGRVREDDCLLVLSYSGETEEIVRLLPVLARLEVPLIAITARRTSALGRAATVTLELGPLSETCSLGLAPSTSTTAMLALGDALALVASRALDFNHADFARLHPGGSLGRRLTHVQDAMRPLEESRVACETHTVREVLVELQRPGRRSGAIMLVDEDGRLTGLFTDSDLARLFENRRDEAIDRPICEVMTRRPLTAQVGAMLLDALAMMSEHKISELPVVDAGGAPVGLLDVTDHISKTHEG